MSVLQSCSWHIVAWKPSNKHPRGYSEYYVAWRGNTPLLYPPSLLISHPLPTLTSMQKMVNWSLVEHWLEVTKHQRHPHLQGTKGDMGWGCPFLGFYCRVRTRSNQGHFKVKPSIISNKNIVLQFTYVLLQKSVPQGCRTWHIVAGKPSNTHLRGYSDYMWLGGVIPHS